MVKSNNVSKRDPSDVSVLVLKIKVSHRVWAWQVLRRTDNFFIISLLLHVYVGTYMLQDQQLFLAQVWTLFCIYQEPNLVI